MKYHPDIEKAKLQFESTEIDPLVIGQAFMFRRQIEIFQKIHRDVDFWMEIQEMLRLTPE